MSLVLFGVQSAVVREPGKSPGDTLQVRPCSSYAASLPHTVTGELTGLPHHGTLHSNLLGVTP
ncbi:hypothetical protein J2T57_002744 [Natronocella acetinitrilica]|uniref:Uncharacterized protein n=1 Tax=Natronocella acetinitrilica TaxID=414046 RepID=A0AAE3G4P5_9GAMM|nr:hypothetical protein [Natronocella acetinitrilica]